MTPLRALEKLQHGFQLPGVTSSEIEACEAALKISLPEEYKAFLRVSNGFNDELGHGYLILWSVDELSRADGYEIFQFRSDRFLIGSNGGPTAYAVIGKDYVSIPFVFAGTWQNEVQVLGDTFDAFIAAIEEGRGA
ncbi:SMI1/KNR4 family protein [Rhizobium terrae]|uniref:SMI1/KNR4 family protein n=1 Tax=Rhizobium terrae TaxID=2171756 RepID=UPI000E3E24F9|nr:SMI1/KNR4 family protein [Rhizobium terrae]